MLVIRQGAQILSSVARDATEGKNSNNGYLKQRNQIDANMIQQQEACQPWASDIVLLLKHMCLCTSAPGYLPVLQLSLHVFKLLNLFIDHINIFLHLEFALAAIVIHVSDLSKDCSFLPSLHALATAETIMPHFLRHNSSFQGLAWREECLQSYFPQVHDLPDCTPAHVTAGTPIMLHQYGDCCCMQYAFYTQASGGQHDIQTVLTMS